MLRFDIGSDNGAGQQMTEAAITAERRLRGVFFVVMVLTVMMMVVGLTGRHRHRHGQAVGAEDKPRSALDGTGHVTGRDQRAHDKPDYENRQQK